MPKSTNPQSPLRIHLEEFLEYLHDERAASEHTLINYDIDLRQWFQFLNDAQLSRPTLKDLTKLNLLREFLKAERDKYAQVTVARRLSAIKSFLRYLHREGHLKKNVARLISLPKVPETLPTVLKPQEVVSLIEGIGVSDLRHKRNRAIVELFYSTGIRLSELVGLNHEHVDFRKGTLRVMGKGSKERVVPIGRHCQKAIRDYIDSMPASQKSGLKTPLFLNRDGERVSGRTIQRDLRSFAREILGPIGDKVTPHTLRHSCATHLMSAGAGLREIQELLGHRSLVTTQKYTQVDVERLKASYAKAHPRSRTRRRSKKQTGREL